MKFLHIANDLYIEGDYTFRNLKETNWANPIDCPTVLTADKRSKLERGDWDSCTALNTAHSLKEFAQESGVIERHQGMYDVKIPRLTESEQYEIIGLIISIEHLNEAWNVTKHGNHGTSAGADIKNQTASDAILEALKTPVARANELLEKARA